MIPGVHIVVHAIYNSTISADVDRNNHTVVPPQSDLSWYKFAALLVDPPGCSGFYRHI